jgi:predicted RecA/RadA family phage recombinase
MEKAMKNFIQDGDILVVPAPYDRSAGQGAQVGQLFGVCVGNASSGAEVALKTAGVFDLTKIGSQAWTVGQLIYWDNTNKRCTNVATGNLLIGAAVAAVDNAAGSTTGRVRLNGAARANEA